MYSSQPCPKCRKPITEKNVKDFKIPFFMKCPHCQAKLKETKITPFLLLALLAAVPLFIFLAVNVQNFLAGFLPVVDKIPTLFIFLAFFYPLYSTYENWHAKTIVEKGKIQLR